MEMHTICCVISDSQGYQHYEKRTDRKQEINAVELLNLLTGRKEGKREKEGNQPALGTTYMPAAMLDSTSYNDDTNVNA